MEQAAHTDTASSFITQLLAPITSTAYSPASRRLLRDLRHQAERVWSIALHRYYAANAYRDHCTHLRRAAEIERRSLNVPEAAAAERAQLALITAIDRIMGVPAPTIGALRQKQKLRTVNGGRNRWEAAIADDEDRLL